DYYCQSYNSGLSAVF
nr:immunoglobulin light chain junction region [Macaca mulatta]